MKVDFLRKAKWYIVGFILVAIMLSVSLSFCAWDTLSFKAVMNAKGGDFKEKAAWSDYIKGVGGVELQSVPKVGDTVEYGKFYQTANATTPTTLKWIVVDYNATTKVATLLSKQVLSCGNYWGNENGNHVQRYLNDYYRSTVRSWLNSGKGSLHDDGINRYNDNVRNDNAGSTFSESAPLQVNKGFLDVAFTGGAETILMPKKIIGMKYALQPNSSTTPCSTAGDNPNKSIINDLVWIPSYKEIYGLDYVEYGGVPMDDPSDTRFSYFQNGNTEVATLTGYATGTNANYYNNGNNGNYGSSGSNRWYWLRTPMTLNYTHALTVPAGGGVYEGGTSNSTGGVRPAVCVQL